MAGSSTNLLDLQQNGIFITIYKNCFDNLYIS